MSVADRNGSLETHESSSPEHSQQSEEEETPGLKNSTNPRDESDLTDQQKSEFDFNEILNQNIPGLCVSCYFILLFFLFIF